MQTEFIAVPPSWTVGQAIDYMRETEDLPERFFELYVVDRDQRLLGAVPLDRLARTKRPVAVSELMEPETRLSGRAVWETLVFVLTGLVFVLIGLQLPGVVATISGYIAGKTPNPTYQEVSSGRTGHRSPCALSSSPKGWRRRRPGGTRRRDSPRR